MGPPVSEPCRVRAPRGEVVAADVTRDPDVIARHLEDAAHYTGGHAAGVAYPRTEADVAQLVRTARRILPVGAQSSLTGGATPFGDVVLSTARLTRTVDVSSSRIAVEAGVSLEDVQAALRPHGAAYPPVPTFTGALAGGAAATNAAGAATFKYGSTRDWIEGLTVVLASGDVLDLTRGEVFERDGTFTIHTGKGPIRIPVPSYRLPRVAKHSAGYFAAPGMDLVDLFIGSEGTLGVITSVTLRALSPAPAISVALVFCPSEDRALELVQQLRDSSIRTRLDGDARGIDTSAIEYIDDHSLALLRAHGDLARLHVQIPPQSAVALIVQLELPAGTTPADAYDQIGAALQPDAPDTPLVRFCLALERRGLLDTTELAAPGDVARQAELLRFRESVPAEVNRLVGRAKTQTDARIEKTAADMIVPFERFGEMMERYRRGFESRGLDYAIWGHVSDGNVHPNVVPNTYQDVVRGREAILEFGLEVARLGGSPLAEHGVGRNVVKQALLRQLYGDRGIEEMRAVKRALDPDWKLAPGVIFPA